MGQGNIRLLKSIPGPQNDALILAEFCARGEGYITAFDPKHLGALRYSVPSSADVELLEFGRMVAAYARLAGTDPQSMASVGHTIAAIGQVCEAIQPDSPFYGSRHFSGLHRLLAETFKELGDWGLEPDTLAHLASECTSDLAPKLRSLADIWSRTENLLGEFDCQLSYRHVRESLEAGADSTVAFPPCLIFLDGKLAPKHVEWIQWAAKVGGQITIVADTSPSIDGLFPIAATAERYLEVGGEFRGVSSAFARSLFTDTVTLEPGIKVDEYSAADPLSEVEWALRHILEKAQGEELRQFGIFARNLEEYGPIIEAAALRLGVSIQIARRAPLASNGYIRTLLALLNAFDTGDVRRLQILTRSSFFHFPHDLRRVFFEEIATAFREGEQAWTRMEAWATEQTEKLPWLLPLLTWRREACAKPVNLGAWRERIRELGNGLPAILNADFSEREARAKNSLERTLGARATFASRSELTLSEALFEIQKAVEESDYTLPTHFRGVQVSDAPNGFSAIDHLFVLGMLEGVFPKRRKESPILTDAERHEIFERRALMFPMPTSFDEARQERDAFVALCSAPTQAITFSHPESTDDRDNIPAFYLEEVKRCLGGEIPHHGYSRTQLTPPLEHCIAENDRRLRIALDTDEMVSPVPAELSETTRQLVAERANSALEPKELRTALECPFRYFAQEALHLYPERDRRRWYQLRQLPQSARLTVQPDAETARQALRNLLTHELEEMRPHVSESEFELMRQGGERLIQDWVKREFRARDIWPKDPESQRAMVAFGTETLRGELPRVGKVAGNVAGTARIGPYKVVQMVESNTPGTDKTSLLGLKDRDALYYGMHLMAGFEKGSSVALEVESMSGGRKLMLLNRLDEPPLVGDVDAGLEVTDLTGRGEAVVTTEVFFERVKDLIGKAAQTIREVEVKPTPGDHCTFCDHGELCRQSAEFGESESPFEGEND